MEEDFFYPDLQVVTPIPKYVGWSTLLFYSQLKLRCQGRVKGIVDGGDNIAIATALYIPS